MNYNKIDIQRLQKAISVRLRLYGIDSNDLKYDFNIPIYDRLLFLMVQKYNSLIQKIIRRSSDKYQSAAQLSKLDREGQKYQFRPWTVNGLLNNQIWPGTVNGLLNKQIWPETVYGLLNKQIWPGTVNGLLNKQIWPVTVNELLNKQIQI